MNLESATLVLRTSALGPNDVNVSNFNNDVYWNINLRRVLGSMFDKYNRFKICLTSIGTSTPALSEANRFVQVNMEGLQWNNQSYDTQTGILRSNVIIESVALGTNTGITYNFTGEIGQVFYKPQSDDVRLRIYLQRISDNTIQAIQYPNIVYCFSIYGIEE